MKTRVDELAVFGGELAFSTPVHVGRPHVGDREAISARIEDVLDRRWFTNSGRYVEELEWRVADFLGVEHCVATCNATTALQITLRAAGVSGAVVVPSFTFVATVHAVAWQGLAPVFCDVDATTHNLDPGQARQLAGDRTAAILPVHLWGRPCDVDALEAIARDHDSKLIFDASHAFGCSRAGQLIGGRGDAEVFSFHATKVLNAGEGGAILTNDAELANDARLMRNFGFADYDEVVSPGTNGKMSEMAAALGLASLDALDTFIAANRENYVAYRAGLGDLPGLSLLEHDPEEQSNYHYVVIEVDEAQSGLSRDLLQRVLWDENVLARRYFHPGVHRLGPYRSAMPEVGARLPATERLATRTLALPNGGEIGPGEVARVCELIRFVIDNGAAVSERLGGSPAP